MDGAKWGLVDLGWQGRLQLSLNSLIEPEIGRSTQAYFFALQNKPPGAGLLQAYLGDSHARLGVVNPALHAPMMEMFCTAPHGTTTAYEEREGRVEPVFAAGGERLRKWGLEIVHGATLEFARQFARTTGGSLVQSDLRQMISELIRLWWARPDPRHARAWGDFPYEDDQAGSMGEAIAAPFGWLDCARACYRRGFWWPRSRIEWCQASLVLTSREKRMLAAAVNRAWRVLGPLRRIIREITPANAPTLR